jgi:Protein of unknown function (DUF2683)
MTSAIVNLTDDNNRLLNIIKAHFDLRNKSDAINFVVEKFAKEEKLGAELRPEYVRKLRRIMKQKGRTYPSAEAMFKKFRKDI